MIIGEFIQCKQREIKSEIKLNKTKTKPREEEEEKKNDQGK